MIIKVPTQKNTMGASPEAIAAAQRAASNFLDHSMDNLGTAVLDHASKLEKIKNAREQLVEAGMVASRLDNAIPHVVSGEMSVWEAMQKFNIEESSDDEKIKALEARVKELVDADVDADVEQAALMADGEGSSAADVGILDEQPDEEAGIGKKVVLIGAAAGAVLLLFVIAK